MSETESLSEEQVIEYLRQNPDLLKHYPELIESLHWPEDPRSTSLIQHQVLRLRRRNEQLEGQLKQLTAIAGENEQLMQRLHQLTLEVMTASSNTAFVSALFELLARDFNAEMASLHLINSHSDLAEPADLDCLHVHAGTQPDWFDKLLEKGVPYCGRLTRNKAELLFPKQSDQVGSSALVPVPGLGLLAIGSEHEDRFHPAMGTLFLELLSTTIAFRLNRLERDDRKRA